MGCVLIRAIASLCFVEIVRVPVLSRFAIGGESVEDGSYIRVDSEPSFREEALLFSEVEVK